MEKKTLIALLLTAVLWVVYFGFIAPKSKPEEKNQQVSQEKTIETHKTIETKHKSTNTPGIVIPKKQTTESLFKVDSAKYSVTFTSKGAAISSIKYKERNIEMTVHKQSFYQAKGSFDFPIHFSIDDFLNGNDLDDINWSHRKTEHGVVFSTIAQIANMPVIIEKAYTFDKQDYQFNVSYRFINKGHKDIILTKLIFSATDLIGPNLDFENNYNFPGTHIYSMNGSFEKDTKGGFTDSGNAVKEHTGSINWVGLLGRYFVVVMIPEGFSGTTAYTDNRKQNHGFRTGLQLPKTELRAGSELTKSFKIYLGEKDRDLLTKVDKTIVDAADVWMITWPIRNFVIWSLTMLNKLFGNMGWALVFFSLITKFIFMPLTNKSTESMKRMGKLTPQMNEIKAKYKDKPDVVQKEIMKLYKENKVNPMGGCLPLVLQMPFFFALYSALLSSLDLWQAPFVFWVKDLSMPDTIATIPSLVFFSNVHVNILPLFMTITTILQQKLTTVDTGGQQQKIMMTLLPVIFLYIFWSMPSGLVLYWALQNIFQVAHQVFVNKFAKKKES